MRNHAAQLAIIKQLSRQELHSTAGNCQADDRQETGGEEGGPGVAGIPVSREGSLEKAMAPHSSVLA